MALPLPREFVDEMIAHSLEDHPIEACGIIAGKDGCATKLFRTTNAEASPYRYSVAGNEINSILKECNANDWDFLAIYHSHTASEAYPSPTDVRLAFWPEAHYILVSTKDTANPVVRAYRILEGEITEDQIVS